MALGDNLLRAKIERRLLDFSAEVVPLPGIADESSRKVLVEQFIDSIHRVRFPAVIRTKSDKKLARAADPSEDVFDPLQAAAYHANHGNLDEACWLVFQFVHFGKHHMTKYQLARDFYSRLGTGQPWHWSAVTSDVNGFISWVRQSFTAIRANEGKFGAHRRYESLKNLDKVALSYINWIQVYGSQEALIVSAIKRADADARMAFEILYKEMPVYRFGRLAKLDYLAMLGKLGLAPIELGRTFLEEATGPASGANLLFDESSSATADLRRLDDRLIELDQYINVGMQAMEDALCNWQKSPDRYVHFSG